MTALRIKLEEMYEDSTGLCSRRGSARIDVLEQMVNSPDQVSEIVDDINIMDSDRWWKQGEVRGDTVCLGYTSKRVGWKNAVFAIIPHMEEN